MIMVRWHWYRRNVMKILKKSGPVFITGILLVLLTVSCSGGTTTITNTVPPNDYESVKSQLESAKTQIDLLQKSLAESQSQASLYEDMKSNFDDLQTQFNQKAIDYDSLKAQYDSLKGQYDALIEATGSGDQAFQQLADQLAACSKELADLQSRYDVLKAEHDLIEQQAAEVTETNIKNALWSAINNDRISNGLTAFLPGDNIVPKAHLISQDMARLKQLIYDNQYGIPYQDVFQATGYRSVDDLVNATMTIWKSEAVRYELNVLNPGGIYGTVDVVSEDGIFYITFMASNFP